MKKTIKSTIALTCLVLAFLPLAVFSQDKAKPWPVPADAKSKVNPVKSKAALADAENLWNDKCSSCHGKKGLEDTSKARSLDTAPGNFSTADFQASTDGELFYRTKVGREDMPSYSKKLTDEEIWEVVNYMRTFKK